MRFKRACLMCWCNPLTHYLSAARSDFFWNYWDRDILGIMSSDQSNSMDNGFTIPKKIPRNRRDSDQVDSSLIPSQQTDSTPSRYNRKLLPTRARSGDSKSPEWDAMSKLLSHFCAREDAGNSRRFFPSLLAACFCDMSTSHSFLASSIPYHP